MCEIMTLKGNDKNLLFSIEAIEDAMAINKDGVGYCLFKKSKSGYDLLAMERFHPKPFVPSTPAKTAPATPETHRHKVEVWMDFEIDGQAGQIELFGVNGTHLYLNYPPHFDDKGFSYLGRQDQRTMIEEWFDSRNMKHDFSLVEQWDKDHFLESETGVVEPKSKVSDTTLYCDTDAKDIAQYLYELQQDLKKDELLIIHYRFKTTGTGQINTQPLETKDFILIHNGVFTGLGSSTLSDTLGFAANLASLYGIANITKKNEEAFFQAYLEQTAGYWSLFIYSKRTKQLYYFRDGAQFSKFADGIMYATKDTRFPVFAVDAPAFA